MEGSTGDNSRINQPITPTVANIHATQWNPPNPNINITTQWNNSTNSWARDENQNAWNGFEYSSHHSNAISTSSLLPRRDDPVLATGFEPWRYSPTVMIRQSQIPVSDGPNRPEYGLNTIETWKPVRFCDFSNFLIILTYIELNFFLKVYFNGVF